MRFYLPLFVLLFCYQVMAYELVKIEAISESERTFVTKNGLPQGINPGATWVFVDRDVSLVAQALEVSSTYTQWLVKNPKLQVPFRENDFVTMHPAEEYLWTLMSYEDQVKLQIKEEESKERLGFTLKTGLSRTTAQAVSGVNNPNTERGGLLFESFLDKEWNANWLVSLGMRYEREVTTASTYTALTQRMMGILELTYRVDAIREFYDARPYLGVSGGYGTSQTSTDASSQNGYSSLLPSFRIGLELPIDEEYSALFEGAYDIINSKETLSDGTFQVTQQSNGRGSFAIRHFF